MPKNISAQLAANELRVLPVLCVRRCRPVMSRACGRTTKLASFSGHAAAPTATAVAACSACASQQRSASAGRHGSVLRARPPVQWILRAQRPDCNRVARVDVRTMVRPFFWAAAAGLACASARALIDLILFAKKKRFDLILARRSCTVTCRHVAWTPSGSKQQQRAD
jgi:hypothetical protein